MLDLPPVVPHDDGDTMTSQDEPGKTPDRPGSPQHPGMVWIPGGTFGMGSDYFYPEARPFNQVSLDCFWLGFTEDTTEPFMQLWCTAVISPLADRPARPSPCPSTPPTHI